MEKFGQLLRNHREDAGLSLFRLATALGISSTFLSDTELGRRPPLNQQRILKAAELLDLARSETDELLEAAATAKEYFEIWTEGLNPRKLALGAALSRGLRDLTDEQLEEMEKVLALKGADDG